MGRGLVGIALDGIEYRILFSVEINLEFSKKTFSSGK